VAKRSVQRVASAPRNPIISTSQAARSPIVSTSRAAIVIEERRRTHDERIELEVMERLANNPRLSGKIGVEAKDSVVRLTGWTRTPGQARRAERDARSVRSVKQVRNEIRPRVGGSV
jgi:osmotically-inducible protein OsmY